MRPRALLAASPTSRQQASIINRAAKLLDGLSKNEIITVMKVFQAA
jgi:hypothetical protein